MQRVAVFVDGENIGSAHAAAITSIAEKQGEIVLARVYGDVGRLNGWLEARRYKVVHAGRGKNATDLLLSLDALEMALERRFDVGIVASSDRDFSHLAVKLRERGLRVIGAGETKTPEQFRDVCSKFHKLDAPKCVVKAVTIPIEPQETDRDRQIRALVGEHGDGNGMTIQVLGSLMKTKCETACKASMKEIGARTSSVDLPSILSNRKKAAPAFASRQQPNRADCSNRQPSADPRRFPLAFARAPSYATSNHGGRPCRTRSSRKT